MGRKRFGFAKFGNHLVAAKSIPALNNKSIRGFRLGVQFARSDLSRFWQDSSRKFRHVKARSVPNHCSNKQEEGVFNVNRGVDADVLESLKSKLVEEVSKLVHLRMALESIVGNFEGLVDSKSVRTIIGDLSEVADKLKAANPSFSLSDSESDPALFSQPIPAPGGTAVKRVGVAGSCCEVAVVVEDSIPDAVPDSLEVEVGEAFISKTVAGAGDPKDAEDMDLVADNPKPSSDCAPVPPGTHSCFSFKSKSKRRRKRSGNSRARQSPIYLQPGGKRKLPCQGSHPSQGWVKKVKWSSIPTRHWQEEEAPVIEASIHSPNVSVVGDREGESFDSSEDDEEIDESSESMSSPNVSHPPDGAFDMESTPASPSIVVESLKDPDVVKSPDRDRIENLSISTSESEKRTVRKAIELGSIVGMKIVGCPVDAKKRISRNLKRNRRLHSPVTSISGSF